MTVIRMKFWREAIRSARIFCSAAGARSVTNKSPKLGALEKAMKEIQATHGKGSLMRLDASDITGVEVIPTGSLGLDLALGVGGVPKGRIVEVYGPEASGKTTLALHIIAEAQRGGGTCCFIDAEHALDASYAKDLGVNTEELLISQPDSGEQALDITDTLVRSSSVDLIVIDSVAALTPRGEIQGDIGDSHIALQARLMGQALRKLTASVSRSGCTLLFLNQLRSKVGVIFGNPEVTPGGNALKFYASVRLEIRRVGPLKRDGDIVGNSVKVKVAKK